jgi:8-oxo-dGTP diphosphatase
MAGAWEFPGGKVAEDEMLLAALVRELHEELGIQARYVRHLARLSHHYSERTVHLHVWKVLDWEGEPRGLEGQPLQWVGIDELATAGLLPADEAIISALQRDAPVNALGWKSIAAAVTA